MTSSWLTASVLVVLLACTAEPLSCVRCGEYECAPQPQWYQCLPWGRTRDLCDCCQVCAQGSGQRCGGPWNIYGTCGNFLRCDKDEEDFNADGICVLAARPGGPAPRRPASLQEEQKSQQ